MRRDCWRRWRSSRPTRSTASTRARRCPSARGPTATRLPDRITIFQRPIEEDCEDEDEVRAVIGETLIHEVGHYFGLSEEEIEEIEERYWRGETLGPDERRAVSRARRRRRRPGCRGRASASASTSSSRPGSPSWWTPSTPRPDDTFLEIGPGRGALTSRCWRRASRGSWPSRSIATWPRTCAARVPPPRPRRRRPTSSRSTSTALLERRAGAGARRRQPALQRRRADPVQAASRRGGRAPCSRDATVMLQKEVADRLLAGPGHARLRVAERLHVALDADADARADAAPGRVPPAAQGHVGGASGCGSGRRRSTSDDRAVFERLVRGVFQQRRKTLLNALRPGGRIASARTRRSSLTRAAVDPREAARANCASPTSRPCPGLCYSFRPKSLSPPGFRALPVAQIGRSAGRGAARTASPEPRHGCRARAA